MDLNTMFKASAISFAFLVAGCGGDIISVKATLITALLIIV